MIGDRGLTARQKELGKYKTLGDPLLGVLNFPSGCSLGGCRIIIGWEEVRIPTLAIFSELPRGWARIFFLFSRWVLVMRVFYWPARRGRRSGTRPVGSRCFASGLVCEAR